MGRSVSTDLQNLLNLGGCKTDTTLDLYLANASELHFATDSFTANSEVYTPDLVAASEIKQALVDSTDRVQATIQNVTKTLGVSVSEEDLARAEAVIGRYYRDPAGVLPSVWVELFRGTVTPLTVTEAGVEIEIINDLAAAGLVVANWPLSENCVFVFKHAGTCGYSGGETLCNKKRKSPDGCFGRDNEHRFGGMEFPDVQAAEVGSGGSGSPPGGGWGGCFTGETQVELAEGLKLTFKRIYQLRKVAIGRRVKSFDDLNRLHPDAITDVFRHWVHEYLEVYLEGLDHPLCITREHRVWDRGLREFRAMRDFLPGEALAYHDGTNWQRAEIISIKRIEKKEGVWVYNLTTSKYHRYFADGIAVSNSKSPDDP